ncbi:MAG: helix-turn-helix domain-containing protein [Gammaproteobacteria bacterium]|nr:helix-turn-helix domain-containing protein [Gammaproteobacteria bacterium]
MVYSTSQNKCPMDNVHSNIHTSLSGLSSVHHTNPLLSSMTKSREIRKTTARLLRSHTIAQTAENVGVSRRTISRWKKTPLRHRVDRETSGRPTKLDSGVVAIIKEWLANSPQQTLVRIRERLRTEHGIRVGRSAVGSAPWGSHTNASATETAKGCSLG